MSATEPSHLKNSSGCANLSCWQADLVLAIDKRKRGTGMFNDDVLARCPECGSPDTAITVEKAACNACGFEESFLPDEGGNDGMPEIVANAQKMARI